MGVGQPTVEISQAPKSKAPGATIFRDCGGSNPLGWLGEMGKAGWGGARAAFGTFTEHSRWRHHGFEIQG